ncbi:hypothetical protein E5AUHO_45650 [Citrobacter freundii]|nr:hypothetical protein E5AUHO_45650 [Citrobacter freundii]
MRGEDAKAGDPVLVEINGHQYHGQVIDTGKNTLGYRIEVDSAALCRMAALPYPAYRMLTL